MLINLTPLAFERWRPSLRVSTIERFGQVFDLPLPHIQHGDTDAGLDALVALCVQCCVDMAVSALPEPTAVCIGGDPAFTYRFVAEMERRGIPCFIPAQGTEQPAANGNAIAPDARIGGLRAYF